MHQNIDTLLLFKSKFALSKTIFIPRMTLFQKIRIVNDNSWYSPSRIFQPYRIPPKDGTKDALAKYKIYAYNFGAPDISGKRLRQTLFMIL